MKDLLIKSSLILCFLFLTTIQSEGKSPEIKKILWKTGEGNYKGYRIPSLVVTAKGTVLAFAEGRNDRGDAGDIDVVLKRSEDAGKTWSTEQVVWNDELNTCGNPCPVVDSETSRIWLWMTWNYGMDGEKAIITKTAKFTRKPYLCFSDDDGKTWSKPVDMSGTCKVAGWGWYATGPGFGIQVKNGKYKGSLIIPANHSYDDPSGKVRNGPYGYGAHVLISDDHGVTWRMSEPIKPDCNESQVIELSDGTLLMNMRSYAGKHSRAISLSHDGGATWDPITFDYQLVESVCQASILNYGNYKGKHYSLFSNPAVPVGRTHMTIKISDNDCHSWSASKLVYDGPSAYSCLTKLPNGNIGLLYEAGTKSAYETIQFEIIPAKCILNLNKCKN